MITIIGAGPIGCYCGYLLSRAGKDVQIFEEHNSIGEPIQCTGLVTSSIKEIIKIKRKTIVNEIDKVKIFSKNDCLELKLKNKNMVLDRKKFDEYLAGLSSDVGVKIFLGHKFISNKERMVKVRFNKKQKTIKTDYLIGADGPLSQVARLNNLFGRRKFIVGMQAVVNLKNENYIEFYPSVGCFAWVVPENEDICRIGVASYSNVKRYFDRFLKLKKINNKKIIKRQGGLIPIYNPKLKIRKNNVYLVGDSATQVKATTGGGIIPGLKAAKILADSIICGKDYERECKRKLNINLLLHLKIRKIMDKLKEKDLDLLLKSCKKENIKRIIEMFDREYPKEFILRIVLREPRFLYFLKFLF